MQVQEIGGTPTVGTAVRLAGDLVPLIGYTMVDKVRRRPVRAGAAAPGRIEDITTDWLNWVIRPLLGGSRVESLSVEAHSSGTSVRARIHLRYSGVVDEGDLPATMFVKSSPTLVTRISNGLTGTAPTEAGFFNELRRLFDLEAPYGFYSAFDPRSYRSVQLLEDLVATRGASFCEPTTSITREQADQIVEQLALLHAQGTQLPLDDRDRPSWLRAYPQWWKENGAISMVHRYHLRGLRQADEEGLTPRRLIGRGEELWRSFEVSVDQHRKLPRTLIHGDTHLGNWYITGEQRMGLCDWQCISAGHWSRDLSYALATTLTVDQRRDWEDALIDTYLERLASGGGATVTRSRAMELYRQQLPGAMAMWTTTLRPPKHFPDMQPKATSVEMLRRILTAIDDHDVLSIR